MGWGAAMSKYEELSEIGNTYAVEFNREQEKCSVFAQELVEKLGEYLECPAGSMFYREIESNIRCGERIWHVGLAFPRHKFKIFDDDFWCIYVEFIFGNVTVIDRFGVKSSGDAFLVRHGEKSPYEMRNDDNKSFHTFFNGWYEGIRKELATPLGAPRGRIGFLVDP